MHKSRQQNMEWLRANLRTIEPGQGVEVGLFRPEDGEGVALLYYAIYGENFPLDYVYDPDRVRAANAARDLYQYVGRTPGGEVVGISALFPAAPNPAILETGGLMILPSYRGGMLAMRLGKATLGTLPEELGLAAVFGQSVCDHVLSQKLTRHFGYRPFGLELEAMPERPEDSTDGVGGRISLLDELRLLDDCPHTVHLPSSYADHLRATYAANGLQRHFADGTPPQTPTEGTRSAMDHAALAKLHVTAPGTDIDDALAAFEAAHPGRHAWHLHLPLAHPATPHAVEAARARGYFYGGLLPLWTGTDVLLMQKLANAPDFSLPRLLSEEAQALLSVIRGDYDKMVGGTESAA
ncbi:GNAT family N-acetyltransferase [Nitratidesulfovibrio sp.]|uniref:GNAT family N-acetyltransferase n=1 Tax=Nitratidesulfovibrio sp. TaxID=2802297 RepID=UPI003341DD2A